jgi:organic radical activating enzyme
MKFIVGRSNLAATIFVPYDCKNNCSFCTTKHEYADTSNFSVKKILKQLDIINKMPDVRDVVFTGGEPFADIKLLDEMIQKISDDKYIFVNTTLPYDTAIEAVEYINNSRINSVNISRHIDRIISRRSDFLFDSINKSIKINCVVFRDYSDEAILDFIGMYQGYNRTISFRADYRTINKSNLSTLDDPFFQQLVSLGLTYVGSSSCSVCNTDSFLTKDGFEVSYHRGIENSALKVGETVMVNDIIIKQDGSLYYDWNKGNTDMADMIKQFTYTARERTTTEFIVQGMVENDIIDEKIKDSVIEYLKQNTDIERHPDIPGNKCGRGGQRCGGGRCGGSSGGGRC